MAAEFASLPPLPKVPQWPKALLIKQACLAHNRREKTRAAQLKELYAEIRYLSPQAPEKVLQQVCVTYLRHYCEQKSPELARLQGDPTQFEVYQQVRHLLLQQIASQYPWLASECERQSFL